MLNWMSELALITKVPSLILSINIRTEIFTKKFCKIFKNTFNYRTSAGCFCLVTNLTKISGAVSRLNYQNKDAKKN